MSDGPETLPAVFVTHAAEILAHTARGLSGNEIVKVTSAYAVDWDVRIPYELYPFTKVGINKRSALVANLLPFNGPQRYKIIRALCDHPTVQSHNREEAAKLKNQLFAKYGHLDDGISESDLNPSLVEEHGIGSIRSQSLASFSTRPSKNTHMASSRAMS